MKNDKLADLVKISQQHPTITYKGELLLRAELAHAKITNQNRGYIRANKLYGELKQIVLNEYLRIFAKNNTLSKYAIAKKIVFEIYPYLDDKLKVLAVGEELNTIYRWIRKASK